MVIVGKPGLIMKWLIEGFIIVNAIMFAIIPLFLRVFDQMIYFDYLILFEGPGMKILIFSEILVITIYILKTMDSKLSEWKKALLSLMVMVSFLVIIAQLYWICLLL